MTGSLPTSDTALLRLTRQKRALFALLNERHDWPELETQALACQHHCHITATFDFLSNNLPPDCLHE